MRRRDDLMNDNRLSLIHFDDFRVEPLNYRIFKGARALSLEPKTFQILLFLLENHDRVVEKRELLDAIWKDVAVTENALTREVGKLRKALGDDPKSPKYIETVHTRGYRFIAEVRTEERAPEDVTVSQRPALSASQAPIRFPRVSTQVFLIVGAVLLLAMGAVLLSQRAAWGTTSRGKRPTTLAVLPFRSLDGDANDRYSGLGIADALITKLSNSSQLVVSPISTILHFSDPARDSVEIGRAMNVDYVLEGKFQRQGDRMRVTVQLLCITCNGASRWAATFDEASGNLFQVQDSISQKVTAALPVELSRDEQVKLAKRETSEPEAQIALAKGKMLLTNDTSESLEKAIESFQLAVARDSNYAMPWTLLADSLRRRELYGAAPRDFISKTREAIVKARDLDDGIAYTHSVLGLVAFQYDWDFATAEREYERALQLQPSWIQQWHGRYLLSTNRAAEAEDEYRRFQKRMQFSTWGTFNFAQFLFLTGRYPAAAEQLLRLLDRQPDYPPAHELMGLVYEQQARRDEAEREFQKASRLSGGQYGTAALGHLYASVGRLANAQEVLNQMSEQRKRRYVAPFELAVLYAGMGDGTEAIDALEQAYKDRSLSAQSMRFDPRLDKVRRESRYVALAKKLGLN
jgi:serine/threonine-protein kinase